MNELPPLTHVRCVTVPTFAHAANGDKRLLPEHNGQYYMAKPFPLSEWLHFWSITSGSPNVSRPQGMGTVTVRRSPDFLVQDRFRDCFEEIPAALTASAPQVEETGQRKLL